MGTHNLRVMIVDDNPVVAGRIADFLTEDERVRVCDRVESGLLAFARIASDRPDVVLMDLEMPGIGGLAAIKRIKNLIAPPQIIVVTLHEGDDVRAQALAAGADAFVPKSRIAYDLNRTLLGLFPHGSTHAGAAAA
jgi:DNA-binding NarL/FixJ family response regulator